MTHRCTMSCYAHPACTTECMFAALLSAENILVETVYKRDESVRDQVVCSPIMNCKYGDWNRAQRLHHDGTGSYTIGTPLT